MGIRLVIIRDMRTGTLILVFLWVMVSPGIFALQEREAVQPEDIEVALDYRSLQPGELLRISVTSLRPVQRVEVEFSGKEYPMGRGQDSQVWLAFLGLDLGIAPGAFPIDIVLLFDDGNYQKIQKEILVRDKEFPSRTLWVKQEYVTPPQEVLERIRWESELLGIVLGIVSPQWYGEGKFIIPSEGKANPNFGERRIFNNEPRSPHGGVDISSPHGAPVRASNSGRVVLAKDLYFAGKTVIIDHGLGVFTLYLHFSKIIAKRGEFVKKGDVIGEIGATGRVTGPHLHWGLRVSGSRVDPFSLVEMKF